MADLPILFSAPMVRAILREIAKPGTGKTQTRRVIKPQPTASGTVTLGDRVIEAAEWQIREGKFIRINAGDRLYVREAWRVANSYDGVRPRELDPSGGTLFYEAGGARGNYFTPGAGFVTPWPCDLKQPDWVGKLRPAMFMPRWASRITLEVTGVKVERLQDCSEADALAEGIAKIGRLYGVPEADWDSASTRSAVDAYANLWDEINGTGAWKKNPWVVAYTFRPILGNIDQIARAA